MTRYVLTIVCDATDNVSSDVVARLVREVVSFVKASTELTLRQLFDCMGPGYW